MKSRYLNSQRTTADNPFATRYTRPGALPYLYSEGLSAERLVERLRANHWWGEIIGPHGVGKSTLLASLSPSLEQAGREIHSVTLRDGQRRLPRDFLTQCRRSNRTQIIVDGYEQLSRVRRFLLRRRCRRGGAGLLVTAHRPVGLPPLIDVHASRETLRQLIETLLAGDSNAVEGKAPPTDQLLDELLATHGANVREMLFDLYNRYERYNR